VGPWAHLVDLVDLGPRGEKCALEAHFSPEQASTGRMRADEAVLTLARGRHGLVASRELAQAGLTPKAVSHRVGIGWLTRLHRGVYLVGPLESPLSRPMAAVLATGPGAALSHGAAAAVWEIRSQPAGVIDVLVVRRDVRPREGIGVHRLSEFDECDLSFRHGVPLTTPARTPPRSCHCPRFGRPWPGGRTSTWRRLVEAPKAVTAAIATALAARPVIAG
jgi:hypothetical protein